MISTQRITVDGITTSVLVGGAGEPGEAVVFVHGNPDSGSDWMPLMTRIAPFARGEVRKTYLARSSAGPGLLAPQIVSNRIVKNRGMLQARIEPGEPNAETLIEPLGAGRYRLIPRTGRTHQLRVHMASLGLPIDNDPLYPEVLAVDPKDFSAPLQLVAQLLEFDDPINGRRRTFVSSRT